MNSISATTAEFTALWNTNEPIMSIARRYGVSKNAVSKKAQRLGLPKRKTGMKAAPVDEDKIADMLRQGKTERSIEKQTGANRGRIRAIRRARGIPAQSAGWRVPKKPTAEPASDAPVALVAPISVAAVADDPIYVRGKPGVWTPPVSRTAAEIREIAERMHYELDSMSSLPAFNRHRVMVHGLPPLAIRIPGAPPAHGKLIDNWREA